MSRLLSTLTIAAIVAAVPAAGWALRRRFSRTGGMADDSYGSAVRRMSHRAGRVIRGDVFVDDANYGEAREAIPFDWAFGTPEAGVVGTALASEGIPVNSSGVAPEERDLLVTDKLSAAGIHLDQEPSASFSSVPRSRYAGEARPGDLTRAVEHALDTTQSGVIVDTTRGSTVEIDEHPNVGKGNVVLIDSTGSRVLRHGTTRLLLQALENAGKRRHPISPAGAPDVPRNISIG